MSEDLIKLLTEAFGDDPTVEIYGMDEHGDVTPLNSGALKASKAEVQFQVWNLIDDETGKQVGVGDEVFDPTGESYRLTKGEPPGENSQLGHVWIEDGYGVETCMPPSVFGLTFIHKRTIKRELG